MFYGEIEGAGFEVIEAEFARCFVGHARVERLWTGCRWAEGPAWFGAGRYLVWSDLPNNRMMRYDDTDGSVSVFRAPSGFSNGNTVDHEGRLVSCEHLNRRVTRTEHDGSITVVADNYGGRRLNSPNDVVVKSDGSIWFTDPDYGIVADYEGARAVREQDGGHVYRIDPANWVLTRVAADFHHPNGLAFTRDEKALYIVDSGASEDDDGPRHIRHLAVNPNGSTLGVSTVFATCDAGIFDGIRVDDDGRVWAGCVEGVHCYRADGTLIGKVRIPEMVANLTFGGARRNRLFICGTTSLYSVYLKVNG